MESLSVAEILLCFAALASTQTPVPGRPPGVCVAHAAFRRGLVTFSSSVSHACTGYVFQSTENPKIVIEAFYDL